MTNTISNVRYPEYFDEIPGIECSQGGQDEKKKIMDGISNKAQLVTD